MGFLIILGIILIYSTMQTIIFKKKIEETIPIAIIEIILIIYFAGIFDNLKIGIKIVEILAIIQLICILIIFCKQKEKDVVIESLKRIATPGLVVYSVIFFICIYINKGRIFTDYDEFNHWARIIKNMYIYNTYGTNAESIVVFNEYPPLTAIFQYFFLEIKNIYSEDIIIIAQNILYLSIVIPTTKKINWNKKLINLLIIVPLIIFLPMIFFENFYLNILVDGILGVMFAYVIFSAYQHEENKTFKYLKILSGEIMLCLTKTSGIGLAVIALIIIFIKIIIDSKKSKIKFRKEIFYIIAIIAIIIVLISAWYIKVSDSTKRWSSSKYIENKENINEYAINFINSIIWNQTITDKELTVLTTTCVLICINIWILKKSKEKNKHDYKYYSLAILISIPIYLLVLFITYITIFDRIEVEMLSCFDRYCSTILLSVAMFQLMSIIDIEIKTNLKTIFLTFTILIFMLPQENIYNKYINSKNYIVNSDAKRDVYTKIKNYRKIIEKDDKILFITGMDSNSEYLFSINQYELMPINLAACDSGNFMTKEKFEETIKNNNYTHIYIYRIKEEVKEIIKSLFEYEIIQNDTLYKVSTEGEQILLERER